VAQPLVGGPRQQNEHRLLARLQPGQQRLHHGRRHRRTAGGGRRGRVPQVREDAAADLRLAL